MSRSMMPTASRSCVGTICTAVSGKPCFAKRARETRVNRSARARALGAAAQDRRIAALQAQRRRIGRHVGPALVNDADDAERHAHARDLETVRPLPFGDDLPDGIVERRDRFEPGGRRFEPLVVEREAVDHRARRVARFRFGDVLGVGGEHGRRARCAARARPSRAPCASRRTAPAPSTAAAARAARPSSNMRSRKLSATLCLDGAHDAASCSRVPSRRGG